MGPIVLGAIIALVVLVLALAGSKLARQTLMLIAGLIAAALLLALWFLLAVGMTSREVRSGLACERPPFSPPSPSDLAVACIGIRLT